MSQYQNTADRSMYMGASSCKCGGMQSPQPPGACTLAAPVAYKPACHPSPFHQVDCCEYMKMRYAYGY